MTTSIEKVEFYGDALQVVKEGDVLRVAIRPVCEALGVDMRTQLRKLRGKPWAGVVIMTMPTAGGLQSVTAVPLDAIPMWLATIEPSKVAKVVRPKLERYQLECARVLRDHFFGKPAPALPASPEQWRTDYIAKLPSGATVRSVPEWSRELWALMKAAMATQGVSPQKIQGWLRQHFDATSYLNIHLADLAAARRLLIAAVEGSITITRKVLALPGEQRQTKLFN